MPVNLDCCTTMDDIETNLRQTKINIKVMNKFSF